MKLKKITKADCIINVECLEETTEVRGNAMASGDDAVDKKQEDWVLAQLSAGNPWAWCTIKVEVWFGPLKAFDYLGCSYESKDAFLRDAYYEDMVDSCVDQLNEQAEGLLAKLGVEVSK